MVGPLAPAVLLWPIVCAWCVLRLLPVNALERASLAIGMGLAVSSIEFFVMRVLGPARGLLPLDVALWGTVALLAYTRPAAAASSRWVRPSASSVVTWLALGVSSVWLLVAESVKEPAGAWDAWAIWNLKAAFLASPGKEWTAAFDDAIAWSHTDYPLLLPAAVGRVWYLAGSRPAFVSMAIAALFAVAAVLMVVGSLARTQPTSRLQAAAGLAIVPAFMVSGASQCADVPLAFFVIATWALLGLGGSTALVLAGFTAGCAAWTKNEGAVAAVLIPSVYVLEVWRRRGLRCALDRAGDIFIGIAPMIIVVVGFKLVFASTNDLVAGALAPGHVAARLHDSQRMAFVAKYMIVEGFGWGGWPMAGPVPLLLAVAAVRRRRRDEATTACGVTLLLQLFVLYGVYLMTPHSVAWHLATSWDRLVAQMWPGAVWWAFNATHADVRH